MTKLCAGDWVEVRSKEEILRTSCTEQDVLAATRVHGQSDSKSTRYSCQATELPRFTTPFPWWDLSQYLLLDEFPRGAFWPFAMRRYDIIHTHWHDFYLGPQRGKLFLLVVLSNALFFAQQKLRGAGGMDRSRRTQSPGHTPDGRRDLPALPEGKGRRMDRAHRAIGERGRRPPPLAGPPAARKHPPWALPRRLSRTFRARKLGAASVSCPTTRYSFGSAACDDTRASGISSRSSRSSARPATAWSSPVPMMGPDRGDDRPGARDSRIRTEIRFIDESRQRPSSQPPIFAFSPTGRS